MLQNPLQIGKKEGLLRIQLNQHSEGRIVPEYTQEVDLDHFVYECHLKDHLGIFIAYDMGINQIDIYAIENGKDIAHDPMYLEAYVTKPGYVYIYLSYENPKQLEVYFDDLTITHQHTPVIQADDYYPFGLTFNSSERSGFTTNNFLYNSKELQTELGLDWYDYGARMYDPALGRFNSIDPLADSSWSFTPYHYTNSNPILFIDPDGRDFLIWYENEDGKKMNFRFNGS